MDIKEEQGDDMKKEDPNSLDITKTLKLPDIQDLPKLLSTIRDGILGDSHSFTTPFGERKVTYADYVASGRLISYFEHFLIDEVYPFYGNTHTTQSVTGKLTTLLREETRSLILQSCGGQSNEDVLIFCGSGTTEAINSLVKLLDLEKKMKTQKVFVFVAIYEHHSNILPWREMGCEVRYIPEDDFKGGLDFKILEEELKVVRSKNEDALLIGSFSACSNITGMMSNEVKTTQILQKYGALSFFDFACCAPYVKIAMNHRLDQDGQVVKIDAVFFSTHKFLGGPGGPGVLILKKKLLRGSDVIVRPGGGTVFFVTERDHVYLKDNVLKHEGGTPSIIGTVRAGMAVYLKEQIGVDNILARENEILKVANQRMVEIENLVVVGNHRAKKLPIFSFLIKTPVGMYLHGNFVSALLNDLFGIQTRAGCMCAGPYGESLLGLDYETTKEIESVLLQNEEAYGFLRPGFTRLNFHYTMSDSTIRYILDCLEFIASHGWKFLVEYNYHPKSGAWRHYHEKPLVNRRWIHDIYFKKGEFQFKGVFKDTKINVDGFDRDEKTNGVCWDKLFKEYLDYAKNYVNKFSRDIQPAHELQKSLLTKDINKFRWFILPDESCHFMKGLKLLNFPKRCVIQPKIYPSEGGEDEEEKEGEDEDESEDFENPFLGMGDFEEDEEDKIIREKKLHKSLWKQPTPKILKHTIEAIEKFGMIQEGDNLLLGLSGGKDSMTLLHVLHEIQNRAKIKFGLACCNIDPCASGYDPSVLKPYCEKLGIKYFFVKHDVIELAKKVNKASICSFCSRMRRGLLYSTAREHGYNVLILAQHLDDLVESFMMSVFHNGVMRTMKANYVVDDGDIRVARPLVFVRERWLKSFAKENKLPVIFENCPACFEIPKERARIKKLLKSQESLFPHLYKSFLTALIPLMEMGEIYDEESPAKKFKTRKMKEEEKKSKSCMTGMTKGVAKQKKVLCSAPVQFIFDELERRQKLREKDKENMESSIKYEKENVLKKVKKESSTQTGWKTILIFIILIIASFFFGLMM